MRIVAFSDVGEALGHRMAREVFGALMDKAAAGGAQAPGEIQVHRCGGGELLEWTGEGFREADALIYIGAMGIAVRAIAPFVEKKTKDPAVLCVDEGGRFVISLLSGHLGGANALAEQVAEGIGAIPVVTTATDGRGSFAVDAWAREAGLGITNPEKIKAISAAVLRGEEVSIKAGEEELHLVGKRYVLGVGMKKDIETKSVLDACAKFLKRNGVRPEELWGLATIDLKQKEPAIYGLKKNLGVPVEFYSAEELMETEGEFASSEFVRDITGADNVCERAAVRLAGAGATLTAGKEAFGGVTFALAKCPHITGWEWIQKK